MPDVWKLKPKLRIGAEAFLNWLGEAIVGLVPLLAFQIMELFARPTVSVYLCPLSERTYLAACSELKETASQEICILTVVISGLALWSTLNIKTKAQSAEGVSAREPMTILTKIQVIISVLALLSGSIIYALYGAHIAKGADIFSYIILAGALTSSLFIAIEREIRNA